MTPSMKAQTMKSTTNLIVNFFHFMLHFILTTVDNNVKKTYYINKNISLNEYFVKLINNSVKLINNSYF